MTLANLPLRSLPERLPETSGFLVFLQEFPSHAARLLPRIREGTPRSRPEFPAMGATFSNSAPATGAHHMLLLKESRTNIEVESNLGG